MYYYSTPISSAYFSCLNEGKKDFVFVAWKNIILHNLQRRTHVTGHRTSERQCQH